MISKHRNLYYDILRVFALFLVIGVHSLGSITKYTNRHSLFIVLLSTINELGVPIFFSLSGFFSLNSNIDNIFLWYKKRVNRLFLPLVVYSIIYVLYFVGYEQKNYIWIPFRYILALLIGDTHPTHWFVFTLLGLTFAAPYIKRMFDSISKNNLLFLYIFLIFFLTFNNILSVFRLKLGINTLVFDNYFVLLYISGYCINKIKNVSFIKNVIKYKYLIIILLYIVKVIHRDFTISNVIIASLFLIEDLNVSNALKQFRRIFEFISFYSYSIYLIHAAVISLILMLYNNFSKYFIIKTFILYIVVYAISQIIVFCINNIIYMCFKIKL